MPGTYGLYNVGHSTPESFISTLAGGKWTTQTVALDALSGANAPQTLPGAPGVRNVLFGVGRALHASRRLCSSGCLVPYGQFLRCHWYL